MVVKLAHFLRLGLSTNPARKIPLEAELELQRSYLEIEKIRYPDLSIAVSLPRELEDVLVPSLIMQPLVENAVKHGVAGSARPSVIEIEASSCDQRLQLVITNSEADHKAASGGPGIGLANVRQRLSLLYGEGRFGMTAQHVHEDKFQVRISLPLELT
jgi:LytS/YehU family sensor histidine kinase